MRLVIRTKRCRARGFRCSVAVNESGDGGKNGVYDEMSAMKARPDRLFPILTASSQELGRRMIGGRPAKDLIAW